MSAVNSSETSTAGAPVQKAEQDPDTRWLAEHVLRPLETVVQRRAEEAETAAAGQAERASRPVTRANREEHVRFNLD